MLPADCSRRLVAELRDALDACAERQRQLERSLRVSRRLLRTWEPETPAAEPAPGPETNEEVPPPACTPSRQELKELELLTQALEKAVRVRKSMSKAGERHEALSLKSRDAATCASTASAPSRASSQAGSQASETKPPRGAHQTTVPARGLPEGRLPSVGDRTRMARGARATKPGPGLRDQQITASAAPQAPEAFTLKEKGILLKLPMAYRKAASQNSRLWAQFSSTQTSDSRDAATTAKTQFLQKMKMTSGWPGSGLSAAEVEAEVGLLRKACSLLRWRMEEELSADPADWMQEYHCLLTLEGLQAITGRCLHRVQELRAAVAGQQLKPWPEGRCPRASMPCEGRTDSSWSPQLLLYSSTKELQTLAALRLRVAMLEQQIHLEKVLMAELFPLVSTWDPQGPSWLVLCRAVHSLLCEGGERFLTILRDEPAD
ncbi:tubulin epsilon and delta complex protein 2 isoform X3 [Callorhinus ursinus]|uniref:Tubulin epsilon and delta complex protein 2 n=1 Tax=Callorhinus ursinus TaxID=34884 RepID=A0A3Q7PSG7_CALUR|nr:tubulin epsilon and delta complex protein 2 [Callorhinus ursinus]XP_025733054.1 tubulin epsilon and delta complex protein 2-like isoform X2 [Callorhinus ursinus]